MSLEDEDMFLYFSFRLSKPRVDASEDVGVESWNSEASSETATSVANPIPRLRTSGIRMLAALYSVPLMMCVSYVLETMGSSRDKC